MAGEKKNVTGMLIKIAIGIALIILGLIAIFNWRYDLAIVFRGCVGLFLILAGVISLAIAKE